MKKNIISEITQISKKGIKEVVITGIHIASYGKDFKQNYQLIDLLEEINNTQAQNRNARKKVEKLVTFSFAFHKEEKVVLPVHRQIIVEIKL